METKKVKRFTALLSKSMDIVKTELKHQQVQNLAEKARLSILVEVSNLDEKIESQARALLTTPTEDNFRKLAQLIQDKKDTQAQLDYLKNATEYLEEDVEVEDNSCPCKK